MASSTTARIRENKIGSIGTDSLYHVACMITDGGIGMCGGIVQEHVAGLLGMFGWRGLTVGDFFYSWWQEHQRRDWHQVERRI
jgi:hypothetical protein